MGVSLPSGRLVFFFSDVEGSTRLLTGLGDRFAPLLAEQQRLVRASFAAHRGVEVSTEGDSFFAVFGSPLQAVMAAADVQRSLQAYPWPTGHAFRVRVGLHLGQAVLAGDNYVGIDVNRAARIANAANGGQVVISDEVAATLAGELPAGIGLEDLGRHRLRDIGVEHLWQLEIEGLPRSPDALRTLEAHPSNVPVETTPLVDRHTEVPELARLIAETPLVTVTGTGGIGKSHLAVHVARSLVDDFPDGVFYLDVAPIDTVETIAVELAGHLDLRIPSTGGAVDALLSHLRGRRILLVLETVDRHPGIAALLAQIAESSPSARVLVTARSPLHLRAERELPLQPLGIPGRGATLEEAAGSPAVQLFVQRARAVSPGFDLAPTNVGAVSAIVERLDGLPLAVELAAAGARVLSPAAILARLERSLPLPGGAAVDLPERQRTVRATVSWSYQLLDPGERRLLQRLSVFVGAFDLEAVEVVAMDGDARLGDGDGLEVLGRLVDRSLVHRVGSIDEDRYRLLGVIREFAAAELAAAGEDEGVRGRHARYCLEVARREAGRLDGPGEGPALAALERADDDLRAALQWATEGASPDHLGLRLVAALGRAWYLRGRVHEGASWLERALGADHDTPPDLRLAALHWLGVMLDEQHDNALAIWRLEEALGLARAMGDELTVARELNSLGVAHLNLGEHDPAESLFAESLALRRRLGETAAVAAVLTNLGLLALDRGMVEAAIEPLEEALAIDRTSGAEASVAYSSAALGTALLRGGRRDEALGLLRAALARFCDLDDADGVAEGLERLGEASRTEDPPYAVRLLLAARSIRDRERRALRPIDRAKEEELFASTARAVAPEELAAARADAGAMDLDAAVAYALAGHEG